MDFTIKSRYGQVVLNKPVFLPYPIPTVRHPSVIVHTFKLEYLWSQLANLDQILCVASLGWGKGCIRFWGRLDQISGFHGNRNPHWLTVGKTMSPPFLGCFFIWSFLYLQVTRTCIKSRTSSNFCQIGPLTTELYALKRSHWLWMGKMVSPSFLSCYEFRLHQTYRKWGQA